MHEDGGKDECIDMCAYRRVKYRTKSLRVAAFSPFSPFSPMLSSPLETAAEVQNVNTFLQYIHPHPKIQK